MRSRSAQERNLDSTWVAHPPFNTYSDPNPSPLAPPPRATLHQLPSVQSSAIRQGPCSIGEVLRIELV